jgi:hypothetical protein
VKTKASILSFLLLIAAAISTSSFLCLFAILLLSCSEPPWLSYRPSVENEKNRIKMMVGFDFEFLQNGQTGAFLRSVRSSVEILE